MPTMRGKVSTWATICPKCGAHGPHASAATVLGGLACIAVTIWIFSTVSSPDQQNRTAQAAATSSAQTTMQQSPRAPVIHHPKGTYFIVADAWTCKNPQDIDEVEQIIKRGERTPDKELPPPDQRRFDQLTRNLNCIFAGHMEPQNQGLQDTQVNIMRVDGKYVYLCDKLRDCAGGSILCTYALAADIRDNEGHSVTQDQLEKEARGKTVADIKETLPDLNSVDCH